MTEIITYILSLFHHEASRYISYIQLDLYANHHKRSGLSKILSPKTKSGLSHNFEHKFYITYISSLIFLQLNTHEKHSKLNLDYYTQILVTDHKFTVMFIFILPFIKCLAYLVSII